MDEVRRREFLLAAVAVLAAPLSARAVPAGAISRTATINCEYRAVAALHPDPKLRNPDTLAARLCQLVRLPGVYKEAREIIDRDPEGYAAYFYANARTHYIDALLAKAAVAGVTQVVVLGAGLDSRAYRFHDVYPQLEFFEVDLPAAVQEKKRVIAEALGGLPAWVHYAPIDFNTQSLSDVLPREGYDPHRKSFFILEGVSMYVAEPGVAATFDFVSRNSPPGSEIVYDYVLRRVIEGDYEGLYAARRIAQAVMRSGEPFVTGWAAAQEAARFAQLHGLAVREDLDPATLTLHYLTGSDGKPDGRILDWVRVIDAEVR